MVRIAEYLISKYVNTDCDPPEIRNKTQRVTSQPSEKRIAMLIHTIGRHGPLMNSTLCHKGLELHEFRGQPSIPKPKLQVSHEQETLWDLMRDSPSKLKGN